MLPQSSQQQAEWRYPQPSRRPLPQGHGIPRHGPYGQGAQGLRRRHRGTASPSTPGESPTSTWEHTRPRWATSTPCWGSTPTTPRRSAGQGRRPGQPGPLRRGGRGLRPVPGARPRHRRGPRGPGAGPQQPGAARAGDRGLQQGPGHRPPEQGRPLQPGDRPALRGPVRERHRGLRCHHQHRAGARRGRNKRDLPF